jgi:hypothetical protein
MTANVLLAFAVNKMDSITTILLVQASRSCE